MVTDVADIADATILRHVRRWWSVAGLALFAATWKLWTPQTEFPQVPLFGWACSLPAVVDWLAFGVLCGSLTFAAVKPELRRSWLAFVASLSVLIVLDQHRLQPWAWQLLLMAFCWSAAFRPSSNDLALLRLLTISIYFWSAVSKLDVGFYFSHGQTLVEALFQAVGINVAPGPARWKFWLAHLLPIGELLVAIGLCWRRTRRVGLVGAIVLHMGLILALGPTGLGHRPGVLLWNVAFIGHDWLLFGRRRGAAATLARRASEGVVSPMPLVPSLARRVGVAVILFACAWPITERWGLCDSWPAWSVYSVRGERVSVTLTDEGVRRLPESARSLAIHRELWLDRWSLAALDVPIYPQLRFQFGIVDWLRQHCADENLVEIIIWHSHGGSGGIERLTIEQLSERRHAFWINTRPRSGSLASQRQ